MGVDSYKPLVAHGVEDVVVKVTDLVLLAETLRQRSLIGIHQIKHCLANLSKGTPCDFAFGYAILVSLELKELAVRANQSVMWLVVGLIPYSYPRSRNLLTFCCIEQLL